MNSSVRRPNRAMPIAQNLLIENNLRFIKKTAYEVWSAQRELNAALGIEINDLVQEGALGLLDCISGYRPDTGNKFLTYAAPAIRNAMVDYIRSYNLTFEAKNLGNIIRLDEVAKDENRGKREYIADLRSKRRNRYIWHRNGSTIFTMRWT